MTKFTKILVSALCCTALVFGAAGCTGNGDVPPANEPVQRPDWSQEEGKVQFQIGMWAGIPSVMGGNKLTDEEFSVMYDLLAASGINMAQNGLTEMSREYNLRALAEAERVGIGQIIQDGEVTNYLLNLADNPDYDHDAAVEWLKAHSEPYLAFDSFRGYFIADEPSRTAFDSYEAAIAVFNEALPDKIFYVNLFPDYATTAQLGGVTYVDYIEEFAEVCDLPYISYDYYILRQDERGNPYLRDTYLLNLDRIVRLAKESGRDMWTFGCTVGHYGGTIREITSEADAAFQMYTSLAYGSRCMQWFTFAQPEVDDYGPAMIDTDGKTTAAYDAVKKVNADVQAFAHVLLSFDWQGILLSQGTQESTDGQGNFAFVRAQQYEFSQLQTISEFASSRDAIMGVYRDAQGREGFMVADFNDPIEGKENSVTLTLRGKTHALVFSGGEEKEVECPGGKLTVSLTAGGGAFVVPY